MSFATTDWTKTISKNEWNESKSIAVANDGSIYILGNSKGDLNGEISSGKQDVYVTKLDSKGEHLWTKLIGSDKNDEAKSLTIGDEDGQIYITGDTKGDINNQTNKGGNDAFITKLNTNGDHIWTKAIATKKDDESFSIISDKNGSIYVSGSTQGNLNNTKNKGEEDAFITKFNTDGDLLWTTLIGGTGSQWSTSIAIAEDGSIYGCGSIDGGLDMESHSETDVFAYKLNSDGKGIWTKALGGSGLDEAQSIDIDNDGSIIITGFTDAEYENISNLGFLHDIFVSKLNPNGKTIWNELIGTEDNDKAYSVEVGEDNSIYIGGFTAGDLEGVAHNGAALVTKLNPNGSQSWMKVYGSTMSPNSGTYISLNNGNVFLTSQEHGDDEFGGTDFEENDAFVAKIIELSPSEYAQYTDSDYATTNWDTVNYYSLGTNEYSDINWGLVEFSTYSDSTYTSVEWGLVDFDEIGMSGYSDIDWGRIEYDELNEDGYTDINWGNVEFGEFKSDSWSELDWGEVQYAEFNDSSYTSVDWGQVQFNEFENNDYKAASWNKVQMSEFGNDDYKKLNWGKVEYKEVKKSNDNLNDVDWGKVQTNEWDKGDLKVLTKKSTDKKLDKLDNAELDINVLKKGSSFTGDKDDDVITTSGKLLKKDVEVEGGDGNDTFVLKKGAGSMVINDFEDNVDEINFAYCGSASKIKLKQVGDDTLIYSNKDLLATVENTNKSVLKKSAFGLV